MTRPVITIDCETDPFNRARDREHNQDRPGIKPFLWGCFDGVRYREFQTADALVDFLAPLAVVVYAHNGGRFDYYWLLHRLTPGDPIMLIGGRLASFRIGLCEFRDSYNILPVPLAAYRKDEMDYSIMERDQRHRSGNWEKIKSYLRGDCVYLHELVSAFQAEHGQALTLAGAAVKCWAAMRGEKPPRSSKAFYFDIKPWYHGGRVECFERGDIVTDFRVVDINSAYPYAMIHSHPISTEYVDVSGRARSVIDADSFYEVRARSRGALPFKSEGGRLVFPDDGEARVYSATGWEVLAGLETKTLDIEKVLRRVRFTRYESFGEYVNRFFSEKAAAKERMATDEAAKADYLIAKLMQNALYGKFSAGPHEYQRHTLAELGDEPAWGYEQSGLLGPWALHARALFEDEQRFYNVATGASITGFVRAYLWRAIRKCGGVLYCDTDAVAARDCHALPVGKGLGEWSIEGNFSRACIGGKKLYAFKRAGKLAEGEARWKVASKGVKLSWRELARVANGEAVIYKPESPTFSVHHPARYVDRKIRLTF